VRLHLAVQMRPVTRVCAPEAVILRGRAAAGPGDLTDAYRRPPPRTEYRLLRRGGWRMTRLDLQREARARRCRRRLSAAYSGWSTNLYGLLCSVAKAR